MRKADRQTSDDHPQPDGHGPAAAASVGDRTMIGLARFTHDDHDDLLAFLRRNYGAGAHQSDEAVFSWRFDGHPEPQPQGPSLWICRRDDRIVGLQAALPLRLQVEARPIAAAWAIDLMVDPAWRLRGVAPGLTASLRDSYDLVCGLGISEEAHRSFRRSGWIDLGRVPRFLRLLRPLQPSSHFGNWTPGRLGCLASRLAAPPLAALDAAVAAVGAGAGVRFCAIGHFDERVDPLWHSVAPDHPVISCRDHRTLAWRFDAAPQADSYRRYYLIQGDRVRGYAVLRRHGEIMVVVDHLCQPPYLSLLFAHCLRAARRDGAAMLSVLAMPRRLRRVLHGLGFVRRRGPRLALAVRQGADLPLSLLSKSENWFVSEADSDLDHVLAAPAAA